MELEDIKTIDQAKALAYDCVQRIEMERNNLSLLQQRMQQLEQEKDKDAKAKQSA